MQQKLMKKTAIYSIIFSVLSLCTIFYVSANEIIVIDDIAHDEVLQNMDERRIDDTPAQKGNSGTLKIEYEDASYLSITLPEGTKAEAVTIENLYMDREMWIDIQGVPDKYIDDCMIVGNRGNVASGTYEKVKGGIVLKFILTDIYEYRSILEDNKLYISFMSPRELFDKIIVVDPAFGGTEKGIQEDGVTEKDIALKVAVKLKEKLDAEDIKAYYTRMDDNYPSEEGRVRIANSTKADMLIRIEANGDEDSKIYGTTTVYNETFFIPGFGSVELANILEKEVVSSIKGKAMGLEAAGEEDYVIANATVPAAAVRVGYLTNTQEAILLRKEDYIDKIATGIYNAIVKVYEE